MPDVLTVTEPKRAVGAASRSGKGSDWLPVIALAAFFVASALFISPVGNFPLNDDWIYSHAVKHFMETGQIEFVGPNCASCLAHVLIGTAACKVVGFSHTALRILTIGVAFLSTLAVYFTARQLQIRRNVATFISFAYAANPYFVNLAYTFMTDVASSAFAAFYALLVVIGLRRRAAWPIALGGVSLMVAMACRQTNAVYIAANAVLLLYLWARRKRALTVLVFLVLLPAIWYKTVDHIVPISVNHPAAYGWYQNQFNHILVNLVHSPMNAIYEISIFAGKSVMNVGLVLLPIIVSFAVCYADLVRKQVRLLGLWFALGTATVVTTMTKMMVFDGKLMPFSQNILRVPLLGSLGIMGVSFANLNKTSRLIMTHVSAGSAILLIALLLGGMQRSIQLAWRSLRQGSTANVLSERRDSQVAVKLFLGLSAIVAYGLVVLQSSINDLDRYYLILAAPTTAFLCVLWRWLRVRPLWFVSIPLLGVIALYSVCAQQDHMSWNRARWAAAASLEAKGVSATDIDGGAEYNLDHNHKLYDLRAFGQKRLRGWRWYPVQGEKYIVSFSPIPGYEVIEHCPYWSALCFGNKEVLILKEVEAAPAVKPATP